MRSALVGEVALCVNGEPNCCARRRSEGKQRVHEGGRSSVR